MVHSESRKSKKGQKTVKTHQEPFLCSLQCAASSAEFTPPLCNPPAWTFSELAGLPSELLFLSVLKLFYCYFASELMLPSFIGNLSTLGIRPGISKEGSLLLKTEIPEEISLCHHLDRKKKTKSSFPSLLR